MRVLRAVLASVAMLGAAMPAAAGDDPEVVTLGAGLYDLVSHHPHAFKATSCSVWAMGCSAATASSAG
jgi:hypothetical protein